MFWEKVSRKEFVVAGRKTDGKNRGTIHTFLFVNSQHHHDLVAPHTDELLDRSYTPPRQL